MKPRDYQQIVSLGQAHLRPWISDCQLVFANGKVLQYFDTVSFNDRNGPRMVCGEPNPPQTQITQDLCADSHIALHVAVAFELRKAIQPA